MKLRPIASTRTSASPSFGDGSAMSSRRRASGPPGAETRIAFMAGSLRRTGKSRPARVTCCDEVSRGEAHGHANRERHDGRDRGPGRPLLGRADAAFAPELRDRRDPVLADLEVLERTLRLRAPVAVGRDRDLAHRVFLDSRVHALLLARLRRSMLRGPGGFSRSAVDSLP